MRKSGKRQREAILLPGEPIHRALLSPETLERLRAYTHRGCYGGPVQAEDCGRRGLAFESLLVGEVTPEPTWQPDRRGLPASLRERMDREDSA